MSAQNILPKRNGLAPKQWETLRKADCEYIRFLM